MLQKLEENFKKIKGETKAEKKAKKNAKKKQTIAVGFMRYARRTSLPGDISHHKMRVMLR